IAERVSAEGQRTGLSAERGTMRVELLDTIRREAVQACTRVASTNWHGCGYFRTTAKLLLIRWFCAESGVV
ncbi:MAG: hypothetical protein ACRDKL_06680, partial [Solirubrobacteraceae bacterium]